MTVREGSIKSAPFDSELLKFQIIDRIIEQTIIVDNNTGCWFIKDRDITKYQYLKLRFGKIKILAHILSAIIFLNYNREPGQMICHKCDIPACFNPHHIYIGTALTNAKDRNKTVNKNYKEIKNYTPEELELMGMTIDDDQIPKELM